jgi:3-oxoacyl-[acyl-carrier protein] reductase
MNDTLPPGFDFRGYRVLVAGGSKGIGRSIALAFAGAGAAVSVCARGRTALDEVARDITARGATAHVQSCDLADPAAIQAWVEAAAGALGGIDVLVNNASGYGFGDDDAGWLAGSRST